MSRRHAISLAAAALVLGFAGTALAATGQFGNECSWGLANHKVVHTNCSVNAMIKGQTYCFSNQEAKTMFMEHPKANMRKAKAFYDSQNKS